MKTILVVEDTEDDVFFLKRALKSASISNPVQVVEDGQKAIDYLSGAGPYADRETYPLPFLVLLDLKLPYVMGLDVLKWIRARREFDQVIAAVLTSSQQDHDLTETTRLGGNFYFVKPPSAQKLSELVQKLASQWGHAEQ
jgi:CheY-like chemotaxis protein